MTTLSDICLPYRYVSSMLNVGSTRHSSVLYLTYRMFSSSNQPYRHVSAILGVDEPPAAGRLSDGDHIRDGHGPGRLQVLHQPMGIGHAQHHAGTIQHA